jgi:hypothetical protein
VRRSLWRRRAISPFDAQVTFPPRPARERAQYDIA